MDPLTHTLVGVTLAETGLKRHAPLASATLIIGANLPDIDGAATLFGRDMALWLRRGWTHGIPAMLILPVLLAGAIHLWGRRRSTAAPPRMRALLPLAYLAVLSHPALDWLNNYGVRLLMPFDGRWFYGDALFIVDPWLWLLLGGAVALSCTRSRLGIIGWASCAAAATGLVLGVDAVPRAARACWVVGLSLIVAVRAWRGGTASSWAIPRVCLGLSALYIAAMVAATAIAVHDVERWSVREGVVATAVMAAPVPANPFRRQVVIETPARYHFLELDWLGDRRLRADGPSLDRQPVSPIVEAALAAPAVRGLAGWLRFPSYAVDALPDGYRVTIRDMRYARTLATGLGTATVDLDSQLRPR